MHKSVNKIIAFFLAATIFLVSGMMLGIKAQISSEHDRYAVELNQATKIAIVNQDMGVVYNNNKINFAQNVIDTLDDSCVLVSKAEGEAGLKNGIYSAVISFPGDFSYKIAGINLYKPEKANFFYKLNTNLSQKDTITTLLKIISIEEDVKERISFMYVSSILSELHSAQGTSDDIIKNSEKSVELVRVFKDGDYRIDLRITEIDSEVPTVEVPNYEDFMRKNNEYLDEWSVKIDDILKNTDAEYKNIASKGSASFGTLSGINDSINEINSFESYSGKIAGNSVSAPDYFEFVKLVAEDGTQQYLNTLSAQKLLAKDNIIQTLGQSGFKPFVKQTLGYSENRQIITQLGLSIDETLVTLGESSQETIEKTYGEKYRDAVLLELGASNNILLGMSIDIEEIMIKAMPDYPTDDLNKYYSTANKELNKIALEKIFEISNLLRDRQLGADTASMEKSFNDYLSRQERSVISNFALVKDFDYKLQSDLKSQFNDLKKYIKDKEEATKKSLSDEYTTAQKSISDFEATLLAFEVYKFYSDNLEGYSNIRQNMQDNYSGWNEKINEVLQNRDDILFKNYGQYQEHLYKIMEDMNLSREEAEKVLNQAMEDLLLEELISSENTKELVDTFSQKLPNTHIGTQGNNDYYNFVVSPASAKEDGVETTTGNAFKAPQYSSITKIFTPLVYVLIMLLVSAIAFAVWLYYKYRKLLAEKNKDQL